MNTKKWYHLFLLTGFMMLVSLGMSVKADAATIMDLERKFPNGAYWNHVVQSGHRYSNYNDVGSCNNPDGYTWTPCNTHKGSVGVGGYDCNSFGGGMQCNGFARKLAYDLYGSMHSSWGRGNINTLKRGDVIHYKAADTDPGYGHWVMVIGRSGTTVTLGEANRDGRCKISWGRTLNLATVTSYEIYSAPYEAAFDVADTQAPTLSNVRITDVNADGYTVVCDVSDNVGVSKIEFPSWNIDIHQGEDANWIAGSVSGNTATARIPLSALKSGVIQGNYLTDIYAWDAAGNRSSIRCPIVYIDRTAPTLSDVRIVEQDSKGYILECKASDDKAVDRVQFPTWTKVNDQDDLAADWVHNSSITGTKVGDDVYRFRVNISEHNNEYGRYVTHVYVFDKCGNNVAIPIDARIVGGLAPQKILKNGNALLTLYNEDYSWNDINALASGMRSSLAEIQDEEKDKVIKDFVADQIRKYYYIGASMEEKGKAWKWNSGSEVSYTNWGMNQPDCAGDNEFYLAVTQLSGKWNDMPSYFNDGGFIVETPLDMKADAEFECDGKIVKFYKASLPYKVAQRFCEENGGSLVKIDSQEKNDAIAKKVAEIDEWTFFIGATDEKEEGTFVWQDGSPLTYRNWAANEPNNDTICGTENYVQMYRDGTWNDLPGWKNRVGFIGEFDKEPAPTPTVKPQETKAPQESAGPQQTKAPQATKTPQNTSVSQATAKPQQTKRPQTTSGTQANKTSNRSNAGNASSGSSYKTGSTYKKVIPKRVTGVKVKKSDTNEWKIFWKKVKKADHYQVKLARNRAFTKGKKLDDRYSTTDYFWNLRKKKTYYIKVRAVYYNYNNATYYYGKWSRIKKTKIK